MRTITTALGLLLVLPAFGGGKDVKTAAPAYQRSAETKFIAKVAEVREAPKGASLEGIFLSVTVKAETLNVYVGPKEFVKLFGVTFNVGEEIEVTGAKAEIDGAQVILAREINVGRVTLILRDEDGWPNWDYNKPRPFPTGL